MSVLTSEVNDEEENMTRVRRKKRETRSLKLKTKESKRVRYRYYDFDRNSEPKIYLCHCQSFFFYHEETLEKATSLMVTGQLDNVRIVRLIFLNFNILAFFQ